MERTIDMGAYARYCKYLARIDDILDSILDEKLRKAFND